MSVAVGFTEFGMVSVRDLESERCWLMTVEAALEAAEAFETHARDPIVLSLGKGSLEITADGVGFIYSGTPALIADMAAQLRDAASSAASKGAAGHA